MKKIIIYAIGELIALYLSVIIHLSFINSDVDFYGGLIAAAFFSLGVHVLIGFVTYGINEMKI